MPNRMRNLWTLGGLSLPELLRRTARESWDDDVFGQGGRMAFYHFLAIFPSLLLFIAVCARIPHFGAQMKHALGELSGQMMASQVSQLLTEMTGELNQRSRFGLGLISLAAAAIWAALNGTWAMIAGLNVAYEVKEHRDWRRIAVTIVGMTLSLAVAGSVAVFLIFCSAYLQGRLHGGAIALHLLEWLVVAVTLSLSFALLYRYAPSVQDPAWRWSTPGALAALVLWIGSTLGARIYFNHVNNYAVSYGHLNGAVMLLLWLYVSNSAILIGGEMNSEIEKAAAGGDSNTAASQRRRNPA
jgi:membrane protein